MSEQFKYSSILSDWINRYLSAKRLAGIKGLDAFWRMKEIDDFANACGHTEPCITEAFISRWRDTRINDNPSTLYRKYSELSQFSRFLRRNGRPSYIPMMPRTPAKDFIPYIFSVKQIEDMFSLCDQMRMEHRDMSSVLFVMPALLRLLYSTGLRISEALSLTNADVEIEKGVIIVRKSKNGKERMVPIHPTLSSVLVQYVAARNALPTGDNMTKGSLFFIKPNGKSMTTYSVYCRFKQILAACGIPHSGNHHGPRVHDLRHTFAVHSLAMMSRSGMDMDTSLPILSACLGHRSLAATEKYVRLTASMYPEIEEILSQTYPDIFPEIIAANENN